MKAVNIEHLRREGSVTGSDTRQFKLEGKDAGSIISLLRAENLNFMMVLIAPMAP